MEIELHRIPIREVISDYKDNAEEGVTAYNGKETFKRIFIKNKKVKK